MEFSDSEEYKNKFKEITGDDHVDNILCQKERDMLKRRNNTDYEDMYLIDSISGKVVGTQTHSTKKFEGTYNKSLNTVISKFTENTLISLHNHPRSTPPSGPDIVSNGQRHYQKSIVVSHNGDVYIYKCGDHLFTPTLFELV